MHESPARFMKLIPLQHGMALVHAGQAQPQACAPAPVIDIPGADAWSVIVQLQDFREHKLWRGQRLVHAGAHRRGEAAVTDLREQWRCQHLSGYENLRLLVPRTAIEALSQDLARPIGGLRSVQGEADPVLFHLAQAMLPAARTVSAGGETLFLDTMMLALHTHLCQRYGQQPARLTSTAGCLAGWQEARVRDFMLAHLAQRLSLADIAAHSGLSRAHFSRAFRQSFGLPPHAWLQQQRIALACRLLRESGKSMSTIALECGFSDQSHFNRVFKQVQGLGPAQWLRQRD